MATGPEHYAAAQKLLRDSRGITADDLEPAQLLSAVLAEAQVHATLALAAVQAPTGRPFSELVAAWVRALAGGEEERAQVWWLDDGHENAGAPELYTTEYAARDAAIKLYERDNPFSDTGGVTEWQPLEEPDETGDAELAVRSRRTGIFVRPVRLRAAADA